MDGPLRALLPFEELAVQIRRLFLELLKSVQIVLRHPQRIFQLGTARHGLGSRDRSRWLKYRRNLKG